MLPTSLINSGADARYYNRGRSEDALEAVVRTL
jgi:hypothetical protein